jgi:hypothetical protein
MDIFIFNGKVPTEAKCLKADDAKKRPYGLFER